MEMDRVNLITEGSRFEGTLEFRDYTRFEGTLNGTLLGMAGSEVIIGENGVVEGRVECDTVTVDGYVRGEIVARRKIIVSGTGRVIGDLSAPSVEILFGAHFDGKCKMENALPAKS